MRKRLKCIAVLELKAAYDSELREVLANRLFKVLPRKIAEIVYTTLAPSIISTAGDDLNYRFTVDRGVAQGSMLSPDLLNISYTHLVRASKNSS